MYFSRVQLGKIAPWVWLSVLLPASWSAFGAPDKAKLITQPSSCVTMHQGRSCFAKLNITWQISEQGDYCLYQGKALKRCWYDTSKEQVKFEFEAKETVTFTLKRKGTNTVIAHSEVKVSWVHQASPRKRRWRLF